MNDQKTVIEYFNKNPEGYAASYGEKTAEGYSFRVRKDRLLELLGKGSGRVLDVGCGPGVMTRDIISSGWTYDGVDISESMIREAREKFPNISFSVGTVEHISTPNNSYNAVVAMGLVEYVPNDEEVINEINRILKKDGKFLVSLPNWWSPPRIWDRLIVVPLAMLLRKFTGKKQKDNVFHREYRSNEYVALLEKSGFTVEKVVYYNFRLLFRPFDYWFPKLSVKTASFLEPLCFSPLRFWATGFIISARKIE